MQEKLEALLTFASEYPTMLKDQKGVTVGAKKADFWLCALSARLLSYCFALHDLMSWGLSEERVTEDHIKNGTVTLARARDTHVFLSKWEAQAQDACLAIPQDHPVAVSIAVGHDFLVRQENVWFMLLRMSYAHAFSYSQRKLPSPTWTSALLWTSQRASQHQRSSK